jgi:hypothetical protein
VRGPAALGQLVNAAVVHLDIFMAVLDHVEKVPRIQQALVHHEPQDHVAAAMKVFL